MNTINPRDLIKTPALPPGFFFRVQAYGDGYKIELCKRITTDANFIEMACFAKEPGRSLPEDSAARIQKSMEDMSDKYWGLRTKQVFNGDYS